MLRKESHLSDQDLLLAADGELPPRRNRQVGRHLQACSACRQRMDGLAITISDFVRAYQSDLNRQVAPENGRDALLKRKLAASAGLWPVQNGLSIGNRRIAAAVALLAAVLLAGAYRNWHYPQTKVLESGVIPNPNLTPGETTTASKGEVCQAQVSADTARVPDDLKEAVFSEYGMKDAPRSAYEVDFLITPELGGSASMRNLWPEPYDRKAWNARTKDKLEDRLHSLVCNGDLDLATAQHEIASNWVSAYKKYMGVGHPI